MPFTTPRTWVTNETVTASLLNTHVRDNVAWVATDAPCCNVHNSANIAIVTATTTALTFDSERYDTGGCHSTVTNTGRITVPTGGGGKWRFSANVVFAANATGYRQLGIRINGTTNIAYVSLPAVNGDVTILNVSCEYAMSAGDYAEVLVYQNSGGNLNVTAVNNYSPSFQGSWFRT